MRSWWPRSLAGQAIALQIVVIAVVVLVGSALALLDARHDGDAAARQQVVSIATALAESGVNSLVARRMVKKQQMQWSKRGAHLLLQVRAAVLNGDLRERLTYKPPKQAHRSRIAWLFEPTPPLLKTA